MEVDPAPVRATSTGTASAAEVAAAAARAYAQQIALREASAASAEAANTDHGTIKAIPPTAQPAQVGNSADPGSLFKQCSNSKLAKRSITLTSFELGARTISAPVPVPRIGNMIITNDTDLDKLFHGARQMRNGKQTDDVITATFDPATVNCLVCPDHHNIFKTNGPVAIVMSDQNFLPALSSEISEGEGCMEVVRLEDASLNDLAELANEIFDKIAINPGSVFLLGSASHLFRAGITTYAQDWVSVNASLTKKFKTAHICPLVPLILEEVAGGLARGVEMLAMWLHKVYSTGIRGMGEVWSCVASHAQHFTIGSTLLQYEEVVKVSLPSSLDSPSTETFFFKFRSSSPA
jgi:hypothetical protein